MFLTHIHTLTHTTGVIEPTARNVHGHDLNVRWDGPGEKVGYVGRFQIKSEEADPVLKKHNLHGRLPPSLFACCRVLQKLDLSGAAHLRFKLPSNLGACCPRLQQLLLAECKCLRGAIPLSIGDCVFLTDLDLRGCTSVSGPFPKSLGALEHLRSVVLSGCKGVTGSLPPGIFDCKSLAILWVDGCKKLSGELPGSFNRNMQEVCIARSKVTASKIKNMSAKLIAEKCSGAKLKSVRAVSSYIYS